MSCATGLLPPPLPPAPEQNLISGSDLRGILGSPEFPRRARVQLICVLRGKRMFRHGASAPWNTLRNPFFLTDTLRWISGKPRIRKNIHFPNQLILQRKHTHFRHGDFSPSVPSHGKTLFFKHHFALESRKSQNSQENHFSKSIEFESKTNIFSPWGLLHPCPSRGKNAILQTSILRGNSGNLTIREKIVFTCPNHLVFRGEKYDFSPGGSAPWTPR